jgi:hypothetical protein
LSTGEASMSPVPAKYATINLAHVENKVKNLTQSGKHISFTNLWWKPPTFRNVWLDDAGRVRACRVRVCRDIHGRMTT